ncbi:MAG: ArsR family transcriptional regulator [Candidatus Thermoplasmatota archaeon]|nr:ArsR family transcriptional regulator [Candidatus Thermoplasmatota archaeon]
MDMLRKKGEMTRISILRDLVIETPRDQRSIASTLQITPQAISDHLKKMGKSGLVDLSFRPPRVTVEGVEYLQRSLLQLKAYIDNTIERLDIIRSIDAIAEVGVKHGDRVSLFMKNGLLYCSPGVSGSSTGRVDTDGAPGDLVIISELTGVVSMPKSSLYLFEVLPARSGGGNRRLPRDPIGSIIGEPISGRIPRLAVLDLEAASLMLRSGIEYHLEMPDPKAVVNYLERGVTMVCFGTPHSLSRLKGSPEIIDLAIEPATVKAEEHYL